MPTRTLFTLVTVVIVAMMLPSVRAHDLSETVSIGGVLAVGHQYRILDREDGGDDEDGVAVPIQPKFSWGPTDHDEFALKPGFAADNGLNDKTPFALSPWAADLEDDVKDINGRNRDIIAHGLVQARV
jgi:porin